MVCLLTKGDNKLLSILFCCDWKNKWHQSPHRIHLICLTILLSFAIILGSFSYGLAHKQDDEKPVHRWIVDQAVHIWPGDGDPGHEIFTHLGAWNDSLDAESPIGGTTIVKGSHDEDEYDVFADQRLLHLELNPEMLEELYGACGSIASFNHHYWDNDQADETSSGYNWCCFYECGDFWSAVKTASVYFYGTFGGWETYPYVDYEVYPIGIKWEVVYYYRITEPFRFDGLLNLYRNGQKDLAYYYLGRVAHLIADMTVPAHTLLDGHAPLVNNDDYEDKMGEVYDDYTYNWTPNNGTWSYTMGGMDYKSSSWESRTLLHSLFWYVSEITDDYDSDDKAGEFDNGAHNTGIFPATSLTPASRATDIAEVLMPLAIKGTAELYKLFWESLNPTQLEVSEVGSESVGLSWLVPIDEFAESPVSRFRIYYGTSKGSYTSSIETSDAQPEMGRIFLYEITGLQNGTRYYFAVSPVYQTGHEGGMTNEISAIPAEEPPTLNLWITEPDGNDDETSDVYIIQYSYFDQLNSGNITFYYDTDPNKNNDTPSSSFDGTIGTRSYTQTSSGINNGAYDWFVDSVSSGSYYIYGRMSNGSETITTRSPGQVSVTDVPVEDNLEILDMLVEENGGDGDGVPESGEPIEIKIKFRNKSGKDLIGIQGSIFNMNPSTAQIDDGEVWFGNLVSGQTMDYPDYTEDYDLIVLPATFQGSVSFAIHFRYQESGVGEWIQEYDVAPPIPMYPDGQTYPSFEILSISVTQDDDGDTKIESGEHLVKFMVQLKNIGTAPAVNVKGQFDPIAQFTLQDTESFPDLAVGESGWSEGTYRIYDIPKDTCGNFHLNLNVSYGSDGSYSTPYDLNIGCVPYLGLNGDEFYDFGVWVASEHPGEMISKQYTLQNNGSADLIISNISPDAPDTSIAGITLPATITPASSTTFSAVIDPTGLNEYITRNLTIGSNAHSGSDSSPVITGTVLQEASAGQYVMLSVNDTPLIPPNYDSDFNNILTGDTDGDGYQEIIATYQGATVDNVYYGGRLFIYEITDDGTYELKFTSQELDNIICDDHTLAIGNLDGDSYSDIAVLTRSGAPYQYKVHVFEANGDDSWSLRSTPISTSTDRLSSIAIGDSDKDGQGEIIVSSSTSDNPVIYMYEYSNGSYIKRWTSPVIMNDGYPVGWLHAVTIGDSDVDGNPEIIFGTDQDQIFVFETTGNNAYSQRLELGGSDYFTFSWREGLDIAVADTDGDGRNEILCVLMKVI